MNSLFAGFLLLVVLLLGRLVESLRGSSSSAASSFEPLLTRLEPRNLSSLEFSPTAASAAATLIINGHPAPLGKYPYFAIPFGPTGGICGAALVANDMLISAAHCLEAFADPVNKIGYQAIVGAMSLSTGLVLVNTIGVGVHPGYSDASQSNDIMVLKIEPPVLNVMPVQINTLDIRPVEDEDLQIIGVGRISDDGTLPEELREAQVSALSRSDCVDYFGGSVHNTMLCVWNEHPLRTACKGDSGGPVVTRDLNVVLGVTSFGPVPCQVGAAPVAYTRLSHHSDFLRAVICSNSEYPPEDLCGSEKKPTEEPSPRPTSAPSENPTSRPTVEPSEPPVTSEPSPLLTTLLQPPTTNHPTSEPSELPSTPEPTTTSFAPTTLRPTSSSEPPSHRPTTIPPSTLLPTVGATDLPGTSPSTTPSGSPVKASSLPAALSPTPAVPVSSQQPSQKPVITMMESKGGGSRRRRRHRR